jgi:hypothetical protein
MSGLVWQYGSYRHRPGEVYPQLIEIRPVLSDRGVRWATDVRMTVGGSLCRHPATPLTPADISSEILTLDSAYQLDYQDFGFLLPDSGGTRTAHFVENDDVNNLSGNKVISRSWLYQSAAEFANTRSYQITVGARFREAFSQILHFQERITLYGNGGPSWSYRPTWQGYPVRENVSERTPVSIVQSGMIVTLSTLPVAPAPWFPEWEQGEFRIIERISGQVHGHNSFGRATHYGLRYSYRFAMPESPNQQPRFWIPT